MVKTHLLISVLTNFWDIQEVVYLKTSRRIPRELRFRVVWTPKNLPITHRSVCLESHSEKLSATFFHHKLNGTESQRTPKILSKLRSSMIELLDTQPFSGSCWRFLGLLIFVWTSQEFCFFSSISPVPGSPGYAHVKRNSRLHSSYFLIHSIMLMQHYTHHQLRFTIIHSYPLAKRRERPPATDAFSFCTKHCKHASNRWWFQVWDYGSGIYWLHPQTEWLEFPQNISAGKCRFTTWHLLVWDDPCKSSLPPNFPFGWW